jgi:hypothetical protein
VQQHTVAYAAPVAVHHEVQKGPAVHQLHLSNRQRNVRIEEYKRPEQLIRVHEPAQPAPETVSFSAPAEQPSTIRVVNHAAPAAKVERVVSQQPGQQVFDVEKPANPADRLIHITRAAKPASKVEFFSEGQDDAAEIVLSENPNRPHVEYNAAVPAASYVAAPAVHKTISYAAPATAFVAAPAVHKTFSYAAAPAVHKTFSYAAPAATYVAAPAATYVAAPAVHKTISYAAPAATYVAAAPAVHKTISYAAAPAVHKTISYAAAPAFAHTIASHSFDDFHAKSA